MSQVIHSVLIIFIELGYTRQQSGLAGGSNDDEERLLAPQRTLQSGSNQGVWGQIDAFHSFIKAQLLYSLRTMEDTLSMM